MRSARGSLVQRIKNSVFFVFGRDKLDNINSRASIREIQTWKKSSKSVWCKQNLFKPIDNSDNTYISEIISKVWPNGYPSKSSMYFLMTVVSLFLDPNYGIEMKDKYVIMRMQKFEVSYYFFYMCSYNSTGKNI